MSLFVSLFGGMFATALLYGLGRWLRLSNLWAALIASGLTCLAYVLLAVRQRPGLDVITLHLVAYPSIALLLAQLYGGRAKGEQGMHWVPRLLLAFFVVLTLIYGGFIYIAAHGLPPALAAWLLPHAQDRRLYTGFAGVVEHDRTAAKVIGAHMKMEQRLRELGWQVEVGGLSAWQAGRENRIDVRVVDRHGAAVPGLAVRVAWGRPGQRAQSDIALAAVDGERFLGSLGPLASGSWLVSITLTAPHTKDIQLEHSVHLP